MKKANALLTLSLILAPVVCAEEILVRKDGKLVKATLADVKESDSIFAGTPTLVRSIPIGRGPASQSAPPGPLAVNPNAFYSDVTTFFGSASNNGGAALQGSNTITKLVADDLTATASPLHPGDPITVIRFTVANLNGVAVSARPRLRFYQDDNGGVPGTLITGFSFNPISFTAGTVATFSFNPGGAVPYAAGATIWAGMTFDDNSGGTGATLTQMNNLGQGIFGPPDVGSSVDHIFITSAAGAFLASNPAGALTNFSGSPVANFGWELATPVELQSFTAD